MEVVLIFDIGKTNKKILLFDRELNVIHEEEEIFPEITDDDGFACDDIGKIESWILDSCNRFIEDPAYDVRGINFTTYGATLLYLDENGRRLTPVYNYLKPMPGGVVEPVYKAYGGIDEFCRKTASPALGMLNSGFQALWLQKMKPEIFGKTKAVLHFPQYLSHFLTGRTSAEHTSIGCHTALWDFDGMKYHEWTSSLGNVLPEPEPVEKVYPSNRFSENIPVGIGIHDSSSSLVPYFKESGEEFILVSTGTWSIAMNPFNASALTPEQLQADCLAYMSIQQKQVKSSRLFMGHIHDVNLKRLTEHFGTDEDAYKKAGLDTELINKMKSGEHGAKLFFAGGIPEGYVDASVELSQFGGFEEAYHRLMMDLTTLSIEAIDLIREAGDRTRNIYITGGFSKNPIFLRLLADHYSDKKVFTSEIPNATSLGAAMVIWEALAPGISPGIDLGLKLTEPA